MDCQACGPPPVGQANRGGNRAAELKLGASARAEHALERAPCGGWEWPGPEPPDGGRCRGRVHRESLRSGRHAAATSWGRSEVRSTGIGPHGNPSSAMSASSSESSCCHRPIHLRNPIFGRSAGRPASSGRSILRALARPDRHGHLLLRDAGSDGAQADTHLRGPIAVAVANRGETGPGCRGGPAAYTRPT